MLAAFQARDPVYFYTISVYRPLFNIRLSLCLSSEHTGTTTCRPMLDLRISK